MCLCTVCVKLCANEIITSVSFTIGSNTSPPFAHTTALAHGVEDVSERGLCTSVQEHERLWRRDSVAECGVVGHDGQNTL